MFSLYSNSFVQSTFESNIVQAIVFVRYSCVVRCGKKVFGDYCFKDERKIDKETPLQFAMQNHERY